MGTCKMSTCGVTESASAGSEDYEFETEKIKKTKSLVLLLQI